MKTPPTPRICPFDAIRQTGETGNDYWSARDLAKLLTYKSWQKFEMVIADAIQACERSQQSSADHFTQSDNVMQGGRWGEAVNGVSNDSDPAASCPAHAGQ